MNNWKPRGQLHKERRPDSLRARLAINFRNIFVLNRKLKVEAKRGGGKILPFLTSNHTFLDWSRDVFFKNLGKYDVTNGTQATNWIQCMLRVKISQNESEYIPIRRISNLKYIRIGIRKMYFMPYYTEQNSHFRRILAFSESLQELIKAANVVDGGV